MTSYYTGPVHLSSMGESIVCLASLETGSYTTSAREETIDYVTTVLVPTIRKRNKATIGSQDTWLFCLARSSLLTTDTGTQVEPFPTAT